MSTTAAATIQFQKPSINGPKGEDPSAHASLLPTTGGGTIIQKYSPNQPPARKAAASAMDATVSARRAGRESIGECPPGNSTLSTPRRSGAIHLDQLGLTARSSWQWTEATGTSGQRTMGCQLSQSATCCRRSLANADAATSLEQSW